MKRLIFILAALFATAQSQTIQTIGAPTTTVVSRGNFRTDSIFYLPKRQKLPTDSGAVRYQISDSSVYYWTGSQWRRLGVHIDTASMLNPYLRGSGTTNYLPIFDASRSVINSKVYQSGTNLLFNTTTASFTSGGISTIENNATSSAVYTFKTNDSLRAYIGWGGASTMDINNMRSGDIRFYTAATLRGRFQTDGTFRLNSLTGTGSRIVVADANGVLSATSSATGLVDTTVVSTRDWRQKGDDSLGAIIATKGSGTVTSVATGYGLSGGTITTTGTIIADSNFVASRLRVGKVVDSLALVKQNVLTNPVTGTGTTNYVPKFTGTSTIGNSIIRDNGTNVGIGVSPSYKLDVGGVGQFNGLRNAANPAQILNISTSDFSYTMLTNNSLRAYTSTNGSANLEFYTGPNRAALINTDNEFYINTAGDFGDYKLQIDGKVYTRNSAVFSAVTGETYIGTEIDAGDYKLQVSGNAYVTGTTVLAATGGNVGVGTASPTTKLHLAESNSGAFASVVLLSNTANTANDRTGIFGSPAVGNSLPYRGGIVFNPGASGYVSIHTGNNANPSDGERIRISGTTGNVLVNTATDAGNYKLQVAGDALFNTSSGFSTLFTNPIGGGGVGMVSLSDPTANGNRLFSLGMGSVNYPAQARIEAYASEAWSSTNRGTYFVLRTTPNGGATSLDRFYIGNDGFVGINTNSPLARLQVGGNFRTDNDAYFATSSGSVAIGRTNPSYKFDILTGTDGFDGVNVSNLNAGVNAVGGFRAINGNGIGTIVGVTEYNASSAMGGPNQSVLYTIGNQNLLFGTNSTERARFNNPGEFLINTTTDAGDYKLQVSGNAYVTGITHLAVSTGNVGIGTTSPQTKLWIVGGSLAAAGAGNGMGIASALTSGRTGTFDATTLSSYHNYFDDHSMEFVTGSTSNYTTGISLSGRGATNYSGAIRFLTYGTERLRVHGTGGLKFVGQSAAPTAEAGTVYYDTDDNKLKVYNGTTWVDLH